MYSQNAKEKLFFSFIFKDIVAHCIKALSRTSRFEQGVLILLHDWFYPTTPFGSILSKYLKSSLLIALSHHNKYQLMGLISYNIKIN